MAKLMRARMYDARRDEDETGVLSWGKMLQSSPATVAATPAAMHSGAAGKL